MSFVVEHSSISEPLTFETLESLGEWAQRELTFWTYFETHGRTGTDRGKAETTLQRLTHTIQTNGDVASALTTLSAIPLLSASPLGQLFISMHQDGYHPRAVTAAYAARFRPDDIRGVIGIPEWLIDTIRGMGRLAAFESGGDPQRIIEVQQALVAHSAAWDQSLARAKQVTADQSKLHQNAVAKLQAELTAGLEDLRKSQEEYRTHIEEVRRNFEERFALGTPMSYWQEKSKHHETRAGVYRRWFAGTLVGGVSALAIVALFLFPFMEANPTAYWAVVVYSFALAIIAWPLRIFAKQYLVHQQLREDAAERSVIAKTFLALDKAVKLSAEDRTLLLGTLMRPASIPLAGDDGGSSLSISDLLAAKTILK